MAVAINSTGAFEQLLATHSVLLSLLIGGSILILAIVIFYLWRTKEKKVEEV
jgi:hypothetical protein